MNDFKHPTNRHPRPLPYDLWRQLNRIDYMEATGQIDPDDPDWVVHKAEVRALRDAEVSGQWKEREASLAAASARRSRTIEVPSAPREVWPDVLFWGGVAVIVAFLTLVSL